MTKHDLQSYQRIKSEYDQVVKLLRTVEGRDVAGENTERLKAYYRDKLEQLAAAQLAIEQAIEALDTTERQLLRLRYIDGYSWTKVSMTIHYSRSETHRIHVAALEKLGRK